MWLCHLSIWGQFRKSAHSILFVQELPSLELCVWEVLAQFVAVVPEAELVIMYHLMGHLPDQIRALGPL